MPAVFDLRHDLDRYRTIGAELVGDDPLGGTALLSQKSRQQALRCFRIPIDLDDLVEDVTILIEGAPKVALLSRRDALSWPSRSGEASYWNSSLRCCGALSGSKLAGRRITGRAS